MMSHASVCLFLFVCLFLLTVGTDLQVTKNGLAVVPAGHPVPETAPDSCLVRMDYCGDYSYSCPSHSTDFEVHRNWLAITHSLPLTEWYHEVLFTTVYIPSIYIDLFIPVQATSEWTLDYPPFFAWFEWVLSWGGWMVDSQMVHIHQLNYKEGSVVIYQRCTVIVTEFMLAWSVCRWVGGFIVNYFYLHDFDLLLDFTRFTESMTAFVLVFSSVGLLLVDHVHFQYNGFLLGLLVWSLVELKEVFHDFYLFIYL